MESPRERLRRLVRDSKSLTTQVEEHGIPQIQLPFSLMLERSTHMASAAPATANDAQAAIRAQRLFSKRGYDVEKTARDVRTMEIKQPFTSAADGDVHSTDVETFLRRHHRLMITTAIREAMHTTYEQSDATLEAHMSAHWERSKHSLMQSLGLRLGGDAPPPPPPPAHHIADRYSTPGRPQLAAAPHATTPFPSLAAATPGSALAASAVHTGGDRGAVAPPRLPASADLAPPASGAMPASRPALQYAAVVGAVVQERVRDSHLDFPVISRLCRVAESIVDASAGGAGSQTMSPQLQAWHLLKAMLREGAGAGFDCFRALVERRRAQLDSLLAAGVMAYLQEAQLQLMKRFIAANPAIANLSGEPGIIATVQAFLNVKLRMWPPSVRDWYEASSPRVGGHPLWPQLFLCLRCGGRREALQLVDAAKREARLPPGLPEALAAFVGVLDRREGASVRGGASAATAADAFLAASEGPTPPGAGAAINSVRAYYEDLTRRSGGSPVDPFEREVACLLGYADPGLLDELVLPTMKDFVWHRLFFAVTAELGHARAEDAGGGGALAIVGAAGGGDEVYTVSRLAFEILTTWKGAEHFDAGHRKPYQYFQMLLQVNRPELAVDYLAHYGHVQNPTSHFEDAVHFALTLHLYGVLRTTPFSPEAAPSGAAAAPGPGSDGISFVSKTGVTQEERLDLWSLVNLYVTTRLAAEPKAAADYISLLDDANARRHFLVDLLVRTRAYDVLLGPLTDTMQPTQGHLHACLPDDEVSKVVLDTVRSTREQGYFADALLLMCRLEYPDAVYEVLNTQLAVFLEPSTGAADAPAATDDAYRASRATWRNYAETILHRRFAQDVAGDDLETARHATQTLLGVMQVFDLMGSGRHQEALSHVVRLDVLPPLHGDKSEWEAQFERQPAVLQESYHLILLGAMSCIHSLVADLKRESQHLMMQSHGTGRDVMHMSGREAGSAAAAASSLANLKARAKSLVSYHAPNVRRCIPPGTAGKLAQLELGL